MPKRIIKKYICFFLVAVLGFSALVGCRLHRESTIQTNIKVSDLKYTLTDNEVDAFYEKLEECESIFESADQSRAKELKKSLEKMFEIYENVEIQRDIAGALCYCDYSDSEMNENYIYASSEVNKMFSAGRRFVKEKDNSSNPLSKVVEEFSKGAFNGPIIYRYGDAETPYNKFMSIRHEYNNLDHGATDEYKCELYNGYLDALNEYARAYGFINYYEMAHQTDYSRDYGKRERSDIRKYVKEYLVPLLREIDKRYENMDVSSDAYGFSSRLLDTNYDLLPKNYIYEYAKSLPKEMADIMNSPFEQDLILIGDKSTSEKYACVDSIGDVHIIYFNSSKMDLDTVVHELGHFYADTVGREHLSFDINEVHSTANVLLMIRYLENLVDEEAYKDFYMYSIYNILYQAVSCAIKDEFEETVLVRAKQKYLTLKELDELMDGLIDKYGVRDISSKMVSQLMTYWQRLGFDDMAYQLSYTAATVTAMQIYVKSIDDYSGAVETYRYICENPDEESSFVGTVQDAGLYVPFEKEAYIELEKLLDHYGT